MEENEPKAIVHEVDGKLILEDPFAVAVIRGINIAKCNTVHEYNSNRIQHFKERLLFKKLPVSEWLIIIANVDDQHGKVVANALMPGYDWDQYRSIGQVPYARGLTTRVYIQSVLDVIDPVAAEELRAVTDKVITVVIDAGIAVVFTEEVHNDC